MPWYTYILFGVYIIACFILIGVVLLQSGKGDISSAFGGGGSSSAFGPRGAASTLSRVTMGAAIAFMALSFIFTMPHIMGTGSLAEGIKDAPGAEKPAPPPQQPPTTTPAQSPSTPTTGTIETPSGENKPAEGGAKPAENKTEDKTNDTKPAETKPGNN